MWASVADAPEGWPIRSLVDLGTYLTAADPRDRDEPFTYVIDPSGTLRLAPRRSEHVACAGRGEVLGAGEIAFAGERDGWVVTEVSNQSTGYCPDPTSWVAVAGALDRADIDRPEGFTEAVVFRRCLDCGERNLVRDDDYICALCGAELPEDVEPRLTAQPSTDQRSR
ncbi:hypothetical protein U2F26_29015 [Micromonospora sp. 4G57]|uniref:Zinc ribbon domain-containing protein n=1 Tax=Micromonospora sicca TaxID=2202420 RepID=A0ABU5JL95_9ACTN|nr:MULTISPECIES: hypothetical protein [unclassified Micromonospora]MDZ5446718.1 hypothetical protein [Micromonospora sp. 4G57]MDZ5493346.1 hypothetical protein [Micromonospora sp. 4G53]